MTEKTLLGGGEKAPENSGENSGEKAPVTPTFRDSLPEEYRDHAVLGNFKDVSELAKSWANQEKMIGKKSQIPEKSFDEAPDEWNEFYGKIGRPNTPGEYGLEGSGNEFNSLVENMHKAGLSKNQAKQVYAALSNMANANKEAAALAHQESYDSAYAQIVKKYGSEEAAKEALGKATSFVDNYLGKSYPEFSEFLAEATIRVGDKDIPLGNHPVMAEAFRMMAEVVGDDAKNLKSTMEPSKEESMSEYQNLSIKLAGLDRFSPEYAEAKRRFDLLQKKLFPREE